MSETKQFNTILDILEEYKDSEKIALICGEEQLTYKEFIADAKHIAQGLLSEGVKKGDRVLFSMRRTADAIRAMFGILYSGASYVATDPDWPKERLDFAQKDANTFFYMNDEACLRLRKKEPSETELPKVSGEDEAAVYYTSGSTGEPKGTVLHHIVFGSEILDKQTQGQNWNTFQFIFNLAFAATVTISFWVLAKGKTLLVSTEREQKSVDSMVKAMERHNADAIAGTPSVILRFLENSAFADIFSRLKFVTLGGERLLPDVAKRLRTATNAAISSKYGATEVFHCAEYFYRDDGEMHIGAPGFGVLLHLLDEKDEDVLPGKTGELFIGGIPAKFGHYLNRPDLDAEKYVEHPKYGRLFRIGDFARLETNGEMTQLERKDGMVKLHGQRIEIGEVENAMANFPKIRRAAVKLVGESPYEMLAGYYTVTEDVSEAELRRYLADRLPYYMVPSLLMKLDDMPENANGKLDYKALPPINPPKKEYVPPETPEEKILCEVFAEVLKRSEPIGVNDSFLALGGDSIGAMTVASRLRKKGFSFKARQLFAAPTAKLLAPLLMPIKEDEAAKIGELPEPTPDEWEAIDKIVGKENVECCYPVTRIVSEKLRLNEPWVQYLLWEVDANVITPEKLKRRLYELTAKRQALRSVFLRADNPWQVVLKEHTPDFFYVDLRSLNDGTELSRKQKDYFKNLIMLDLAHPKDLERDVLFKFGLARISDKRSVLWLACTHLLSDGIGVSRILVELTEPVEILPDRDVWHRRIIRLQSADAISVRHWKKFMEGCHGIAQVPKIGEGDKIPSSEVHKVSAGKKLRERIEDYCAARRVTVAALTHYVFARVLMEMLSVEDICFYSVGSGRTEEETELIGMFADSFPIRIKKGDTISDCQTQLLLSAAHYSAWEFMQSKFIQSQKPWDITLDLQNFYHDYVNVYQKIDLFALPETTEQREQLFRQISAHRKDKQCIFLVETKGKLDGIAFFDKSCHDATFIKKMAQEFIRQLRIVVNEVP